MKEVRIFLYLVMALLMSTAALAQQKGGIEIKSVAEVDVTVINAQGQKEIKRVEAAKANVVPGDTVTFTLTYVNTGSEPATDVAIKDPVPANMAYVKGSAEGEGTSIDFSIDNGKTFNSPDKLVVTSNGKTRQAPAADYTVIRWVVAKVMPGAKGTVSFKAKVK